MEIQSRTGSPLLERLSNPHPILKCRLVLLQQSFDDLILLLAQLFDNTSHDGSDTWRLVIGDGYTSSSELGGESTTVFR